MRLIFLVLVLLAGCSDSEKVVLEPMAESVDKTLTADFGSQFWTPIPLPTSSWWDKLDEGVATSDDAATMIKVSGFASNGIVCHFETEDAPTDLDVLTEVKFRFRGYWKYSGFTAPDVHKIQFDLYTDAGTTLVGSLLVDLKGQVERVWHDYPLTDFYSISGLSLTKLEADDLTIKLTSVMDPILPDFNNDILQVSALDFRYVYAPIPIAENEHCIEGNFATQRNTAAEMSIEQSIAGQFSTQVIIIGSVPLCDLIEGSAQEASPLGITYDPPPTLGSIVELCVGGGFQAVFEINGSFKTVHQLGASVPVGC